MQIVSLTLYLKKSFFFIAKKPNIIKMFHIQHHKLLYQFGGGGGNRLPSKKQLSTAFRKYIIKIDTLLVVCKSEFFILHENVKRSMDIMGYFKKLNGNCGSTHQNLSSGTSRLYLEIILRV